MTSYPPKEPILVVEDEPSVREALTLLLRAEGFAVTTAPDGQAALEQLRGLSRPWLILLDLMMPIMDGFEFRVRQLQEPNLAGIPVVVFSAGGDLDRKVASMGAAACLKKPVDAVTLLDVIENLADSQPRAHGGGASEGQSARAGRMHS